MTNHPAADRVAEALSDAELDAIRIRDASARNPARTWAVEDRRRLLAALDAVRSTAPATGPGLDAGTIPVHVTPGGVGVLDLSDPRPYLIDRYGSRAVDEIWRAATEARSTGGVKTIDPSWCDCPEGYPSYGIGKYKHLPSCRYGIIEDWIDITS